MSVVPINAPIDKIKSAPTGRSMIVAALDIGSTKVCCLIARISDSGLIVDVGAVNDGLKILGFGHHRSVGLRAGAVVDMEAAEASVRAAVDHAERMAGVTISSVYVSLSAGRPRTDQQAISTPIDGTEVNKRHVNSLLSKTHKLGSGAGRTIIHNLPGGFILDGERGVEDPIGMFGEKLSLNAHVVSVDTGPFRNIVSLVERCHLSVDAVVVSPLASAMACLVEDENDLGVTCIDMGGGTTSIAAFAEGGLIYADLIPIGGDHVTSDIARGLSTPSSYAERIKTLYGSALPSLSDEREMISVPYVGEKADDVVNKIPRTMLTGIIQPRIEEILELVRARLDQTGYSEVAGKRLVITGGASQMNGIRELAQRVLGKQVRLGTPHTLTGLPDMAHSAAFSTCAGLISYARSPLTAKQNVPEWNMTSSKSGYFVRVGQWIRENF